MPEGSYTAKLFQRGRGRIAQKVGEEAVEVVVAAMQDNHGELVSRKLQPALPPAGAFGGMRY